MVDAAAAVAVQPVIDIAVLAVHPAAASVDQGQTLAVDVTVRNVGNQNVTAAFEVVLADTTDGLWSNTQSIGRLNRGTSVTLTYAWNTAGASLGDHTLCATAGPVAGEEDTTDNSLNAVVTIQAPPALGHGYCHSRDQRRRFRPVRRFRAGEGDGEEYRESGCGGIDPGDAHG